MVQRKTVEQVMTKVGRRFYEEAPQTEWIIHLPVVNVRNEETFNARYIDLTPDRLRSMFGPNNPEYELLSKLNRTRGDQESLDRLIAQYGEYFSRAEFSAVSGNTRTRTMPCTPRWTTRSSSTARCGPD